MHLPISTKDEDIIHIYSHKEIGEWSYDIIHHRHEHCWGISQAKKHDQPLEETFVRL